MSGKMRLVFLSLVALALVAGSFFLGSKMNGSAAAQAAKPRQRSAFVVFMPTGNSQATGVGHFSISDQNNDPSQMTFVGRIEVSGMPTGRFAAHIHEGFCPPPIGPSPDQQGPIRIDFPDVRAFSLDPDQVRVPISITILKPSNLPTRAGGITDLTQLLDPSRNFYVNVHERSGDNAAGPGAGLTCGRLVFN